MEVFYLFREYMGTGLVLIWYLAVLVYLFVAEKRKDRRILFVYVPLLVLLLFFLPFSYKVFQKLLGGEIFYRITWLLPVTVTISYGAVKLCSELQGKKRMLVAGLSLVLVVLSGTLVYSSPAFSKAENIHHVPQEVAEICDMIEIPGVEVMAAFPPEMLHFVRQYSCTICMAYGREILLNGFDDLEYAMHYKNVDVERLSELAKARKCHYVILSTEKELSGRMEDHGYVCMGQVGEYLVYKDTTQDFYVTQ